MPARQPDGSGGVQQPPVDADEHVRARALAEVAGGVGEDRLVGAPLRGVGRGRRRSRRRTSSSARRARAVLVARPRHGDDVGGRRPRGQRRARRRRPSAGAVAPVRPERADAAGDGDAHARRRRRRWPRRPSVDRGAQLVVVERHGEPEPVGRAAQPRRGGGAAANGVAVDDLQRLEHAVADGEPVVERRDRGRRRRRAAAVDPDDRGRSRHSLPRGSPLRDRRDASRRAFSSVSSHSPAGVESQVMPPPVPKWSWPSSNQNVRMATLSSPSPRSASTQPTAPQYTPRVDRLERARCARARRASARR